MLAIDFQETFVSIAKMMYTKSVDVSSITKMLETITNECDKCLYSQDIYGFGTMNENSGI